MTIIRLRILSRAVLAAICALTLGGVSACAPASPQPGVLQRLNGGIAMTVPALWVDTNSNTGGMEYTTVWVGHNSGEPLVVELDDLEAEGAGTSWRAASASAAAVGSLMSGTDPTNLTFNFSVSGPIDGPSAGGVLTVGVLAALRETPLRRNVTMTGTISPDGSIGNVAGISAKMRAAADNGFDTVVLPQVATTVQPTGSGESVDTITYGKSLGLKIVFVQNVTQAYQVFTGDSLFDQSAAPYAIVETPSLMSASVVATEHQLNAATEAAATLSAQNPLSGPLQQELTLAQSQLAAGNTNASFALAVDVLNQASRSSGEEALNAEIASSGFASAQATLSSQLARDAKSLKDRINRESKSVADLTASQTLFLPSALTWLSYAHAVVVSLRGVVDSVDSKDPSAAQTLAMVAGIAREQMAGADVTFEQNLTMLEALPAGTVHPQEPPVQHLSDYTTFLVAAGQENENYISGVFGVTAADTNSLPVDSLLPIIYALSDGVKRVTQGVQSPAQEVTEASTALSYYATTSLLVSSAQALGVDGIGLFNEAQVSQPEFVGASLKTGADIVYSQAAEIHAKGLQPGFANWSTGWGVEAFQTLSSINRVGAGTVIALNEVWFDSVAVYMLNALRVK